MINSNSKIQKQKPISSILISNEFKNTPINDRRIVKRLITTAEAFAKNPGESIPEACQSSAKTKAVYRLLSRGH
jgi:hypothetical protein